MRVWVSASGSPHTHSSTPDTKKRKKVFSTRYCWIQVSQVMLGLDFSINFAQTFTDL